MSDKPTAKARILERLAHAKVPLAIHEFDIMGVSENALAARIRELKQAGVVFAQFRKGKPFKEFWVAKPGQQELAL